MSPKVYLETRILNEILIDLNLIGRIEKNTLNLLQHMDWWNMSNLGILYWDRQTQIIDHSNPSERECSNEKLRR